MKTIGRVLACVLLAVAFAKNVLATSAANIEFSKEQDNARSNVTRLQLVSKQNPYGGFWSILDYIFGNYRDENDIGFEETRTFGVKRLQFMMMPMMYKMGVMMTMLMVLTAISVKGLFIGIILLVLKLSAFLAKFHSGWHQSAAWSPPQPIHVHVHNSFPYAHTHGWEPLSGPGNEEHYYYKG